MEPCSAVSFEIDQLFSLGGNSGSCKHGPSVLEASEPLEGIDRRSS